MVKKPIILCLVSLLLLSVGWLGVSGVPLLVAFVPLLLISGRYGSSRREMWKMFGWSALTFGLWNVATVWWVWLAAPIGVIAPTIIEGVLFGSVFTLYHYASKRTPKALAYTLLVAGWVAAEHIYTVGQISFPWLTLGNGFSNDIALVQWYDTTGVFGGSIWVWECNLLIYNAIISKKRNFWIASAVAVLLPVSVSLVKYYTYKETGDPVKVTIVQPNIDPYDEKFLLDQREQNDIFFSLMEEAPADVDYIITPETAIYGAGGVWENDLGDNWIIREFTSFMETRYPDTQLILGASTNRLYPPGSEMPHTARFSKNGGYYYDHYNTALAIEAGQRIQIYHKSKLLIGVEMTPFHEQIKKWNIVIVDLGGIAGQLGYDLEPTVFTGKAGFGVGSAICWEGVFGEFYAGFVNKGADVMFIISNDGWWGDTPGYMQLFRYSQLRALETRRSIARSANTGKSGFIDQRGKEIQSLGWDVRGTLTDTIFTNDKITFYARYGDYIARICNLVFVLSLLYLVVYLVRRKSLIN